MITHTQTSGNSAQPSTAASVPVYDCRTCADEKGVSVEVLALHGLLAEVTGATKHHQSITGHNSYMLPPGWKGCPL